MEISGIAFDCCWLKDLESKGFDEQLAAMQLIERMMNQDVAMLLDHDYHIEGEYNRNISGSSTGGKIISKLRKSFAFRYVHGVPKSACATALAADAFDPSDVPYVGAAQNGKGVLITSEEKHLAAERCALIKAKCKVIIVGDADVPTLLA